MRSNARILLGGLALSFGAACASTPDRAFEDSVDEVDYATPDIPTAVEPAPAPEAREEQPVEVTRATEVDRAPPEEEVEVEIDDEPEPERTSPGQRDFDRGVSALDRSAHSEAESRFLEAVDVDPQLEWAWYNLAIVRERKNDLTGAASAYRKALDARPDFPEAAANLTRLLNRQGRGREAEAEMRRRIQIAPAALGLRNALAQALVFRGGSRNLVAAFTEARKVLAKDERNAGAMMVLGQVFYAQRKYELAGSVLDNAAQVAPGNAIIHNLRGFVQLKQDKRDEAFRSFKLASELRDDLPEAHVNYGAFLNQAQNFDEAVRTLELAVRYAPKMVSARLNLGNAYRGKGEHQKALAEYQRVRALDPANSDVLFNLGLLHLDAPIPNMETLARLNKARQYFEQYRGTRGRDDRVGLYLKDADKAIKKEERAVVRERKDKLRRVQDEKDAKIREAREARERAAADAQAKLDAEKQRKADEAAARRAAERAESKRLAEEVAARRAAERAEAKRQAAEEKARKKAERAAARRAAAEEAARRRAAEKASSSRLGDDDDEEEEAPGGSTLGDDDK